MEPEHEHCEQLVSRAAAGDRAAFAALVRSQQRRVFSLAARMLCDRQRAEDLAQEVFMHLHRSLRMIRSEAHLLFWLRKVTVHKAIDRLRRQPSGEVELSEADDLAEEREETDPLMQRRLRRLIASLPPAARAVVLLRYQDDLDPTDIARVLDMSINTVKSHLKRSLASLREHLADGTADRNRITSQDLSL